MLVLTRKENERIVMLDASGKLLLTMTLVEIRSDKVRLGFSADNAFTIHRHEVYDEILKSSHGDQKAAVRLNLPDRLRMRAAKLRAAADAADREAAAIPPTTTEENTDAA